MDHVTSADGTTIAYTTQGAGPALVLVNTTMDDHHGLDATAAALAGDFTSSVTTAAGSARAAPASRGLPSARSRTSPR